MVHAMRYFTPSSIACFTGLIAVCIVASRCPTVIPRSCYCGPTGDGYILLCPAFTVTVVTRNFTSNVDIQCSKRNDNVFSALNGMSFGNVANFTMRQCQLPSVPLSRLLHNITHLSGDVFTDFSFVKEIVLEYDNVVLRNSTFSDLPQLRSLKLSCKNQTNLKAGVFHNLTHLEHLSLSGNFRNLSRAVFSDVGNLRKLNITLNKMTQLPPDTFVDLISLQQIYLDKNQLLILPLINKSSLQTVSLKNHKGAMPYSLLANLTALYEVILSDCNISSLPVNLLSGSKLIRFISLNNNALTTLPKQLFRDFRALEKLDLSFNRITDLPEEIFSNTSNLRELNLSNNRLTNITDFLFKNLGYLKVLNLENNGLKRIGTNGLYGLVSLKEINMANNMLTFVNSSRIFLSPLRNCTRLEYIQLANNSLTKIFSDWRDMKSLKNLNLSHNNISWFEAADLHFRSSYTVNVDISHNNISGLHYVVFRDDYAYRYALKDEHFTVNKVRHRNFYIGGNPFECGLNCYSLLEYDKNQITAAVTLTMGTEEVNNIQCNSPPMLEKNISIKRFSCLFKTDYFQICPRPCSCVIRRSDKAVVVDCHKRNLTSMPAFLPNIFSSHTEINLSGNIIKAVKSPLGRGYNMATKYNFSGNVISNIDLTAFSPELQVLAIDRNNITHINEASIKFLMSAKNLAELTLHGNPWTCDCNFVSLIKRIHRLKKVKLFENTTCYNGTTIYNISNTELCPDEPETELGFRGAFVIAVIIFIILAVFKNSRVKVRQTSHSDTVQLVVDCDRR